MLVGRGYLSGVADGVAVAGFLAGVDDGCGLCLFDAGVLIAEAKAGIDACECH